MPVGTKSITDVLKLFLCVFMVKPARYILTNENPTNTDDSEPWRGWQFASAGFEAVAAGAINTHATR